MKLRATLETLVAVFVVAALFIMLMLFSGCSAANAGGNRIDVSVDYGPFDPVEVPPRKEPEPYMTFARPVPELQYALEQAMARWIEVSGLRIEESEDGIKIELAPKLMSKDEDGNEVEVCGFAYLKKALIEVSTSQDVGCYDEQHEVVLTHEMGHMLRARGGHAESGILSTGGKHPAWSEKIDETSLAFVCETAPCTRFNPER